MTRALIIIAALLIAAAPASAAGIRYLEDPVYVKINKDDPHPMEDLIILAETGDARAQFILGDLYSKGKGGLAKNRVKARYWFEVSARHGYTPSFIRLAALAKRSRDYIDAFKWYTLSAKGARGREQAWAKSELQRLSRSLSANAMRGAENEAKDWLNGQREAMNIILRNEETARATLPPPDLGEHEPDSADKDKDKGKDNKKTAETESPRKPEKEYRYNE